jgi:hypothetical protein
VSAEGIEPSTYGLRVEPETLKHANAKRFRGSVGWEWPVPAGTVGNTVGMDLTESEGPRRRSGNPLSPERGEISDPRRRDEVVHPPEPLLRERRSGLDGEHLEHELIRPAEEGVRE